MEALRAQVQNLQFEVDILKETIGVLKRHKRRSDTVKRH